MVWLQQDSTGGAVGMMDSDDAGSEDTQPAGWTYYDYCHSLMLLNMQ